MTDPATVSNESINVKRWILGHVRKMLRGEKITSQIDRFVSGELKTDGQPRYMFQLEIVLDDRTIEAIRDPKNREALSKEEL